MTPMARSTKVDMANRLSSIVPTLTDNNLMVVSKVTVAREATVATVAIRNNNPMEDLPDQDQADTDTDQDQADMDQVQEDTDMVAKDLAIVVQAVLDTMVMTRNLLHNTVLDMAAILKDSTPNSAATDRILAKELVAMDLESKAESVEELIPLEDNTLTSAMMAETTEEEELELAKFTKTNPASPHTVLSTTEKPATNALLTILAVVSRLEPPYLTARLRAHSRKLAHTVAKLPSLALNLETLAQELACLSTPQTWHSRPQLFPAQAVVLTQMLVVFTLPTTSLQLACKALMLTSMLLKQLRSAVDPACTLRHVVHPM